MGAGAKAEGWTVALESGNQGWRPNLTRHGGEETCMRIGTIRKSLQDVASSTMDTVTISKQTLQEVFYPEHDEEEREGMQI